MRKLLYSSLDLISPLFKRTFKKKLRVLAYHDVTDQKIFDKQMAFLKENYSVISIDDLKKHLYHGGSLPDYPLLITFDDGDYSVFERGIPILYRYNLPSCLFIVTKLIGTKTDFWWNRARAGHDDLNIDSPSTNEVINHLKNVSNKERLEALEKYPKTEKAQLAIEQLKILKSKGMDIANHSHTHPMFDKCSKEELQYELDQSKLFFESVEFKNFDVFAYPNGNRDENSEEILKNNKVKMAFLFDHKVNKKSINPLRISRIRIDSDTDFSEFKVKISGLHSEIYRYSKEL